MIKRPPFKVEEEGWGEFDLGVTLHYVEKEGQKELTHDLNFQESRYESPHKLVPTLSRFLEILATTNETARLLRTRPRRS